MARVRGEGHVKDARPLPSSLAISVAFFVATSLPPTIQYHLLRAGAAAWAPVPGAPDELGALERPALASVVLG